MDRHIRRHAFLKQPLKHKSPFTLIINCKKTRSKKILKDKAISINRPLCMFFLAFYFIFWFFRKYSAVYGNNHLGWPILSSYIISKRWWATKKNDLWLLPVNPISYIVIQFRIDNMLLLLFFFIFCLPEANVAFFGEKKKFLFDSNRFHFFDIVEQVNHHYS